LDDGTINLMRRGRLSGVEARISELAARASEHLDPGVHDYFATGSGAETSLDEAAEAWLRYRLRPRVLIDVSSVRTDLTLLGHQLPSPIAIAPFAFAGMVHDDAELGVVRGAGEHLSVISTRATRSLEEIGAAATGPWWFQVYLTMDRTLTAALAKRAAAAGAGALVLTGDTPYVGRRSRGGRPAALGTAETLTNFGPHLSSDAEAAHDIEQNPAVTTDDIGWLADLTGLPVLVKGVLRADDAARCLDAGAAGVVVSNHGGRQLDRAVAPAIALPEVVAACGDAPVLVDGGISAALDVLTALALGARAVLIGRPAAWALAANGGSGVADLLAAFDDELEHVLALAGCPHLESVTADLVARPQ
jgi:4-hydroxymandelate oxidase